MSDLLFSYLAGAMDADGSFGIKRHTYAMRVRGDATQAVFSERLSLKQVTPEVPQLLAETFGGRCAPHAASTANGRTLLAWDATDRVAANATSAMHPHLRIKRRQANLLLELRKTKDNSRFRQFAYWFEQENPEWRDMPMMTCREVAAALEYSSLGMVSQAVRNGSLLALPRPGIGIEVPRIPRPLVESYAAHAARSKDGKGRCRPSQLIAWRERLWSQCRELNRIGTGEHPIYMRTGCYTPAA